MMKKMKRLTVCIIALVMSALIFTGCEKTSSQIETEAVAAIREANIESIREYTELQFCSMLTQAAYEDFANYRDMQQVLISYTFDNDLDARWKYFTELHGKCVEAAVDETMREGYEYTSRIIMTGEDMKQMALTITYDQNEDDSQQTFGQKMAVAGGNTIIGLLVVFTVLILLSLIIYCFKFVNKAAVPPTKKAAPAPAKAAAPAPAAAAPVKAAPAASTPENDPALIAVIAAAIAAAEDKPVDGFVVRSVRRLKTNKWR